MCYSAMVKQDLKYLESTYGAIWIRQQIDDYLQMAAQNPKLYPPLQKRIFPGHYAPVIYLHNNQRQVSLMRYGAFPPENIKDPKRYNTVNARRDNLTSPFWSNAFMKHHGVVILEGFFEWVAVKDLLQAGHVTIEQVRKDFELQKELRKTKIIEAGKPYKPTPTEIKDPRFRKIVIQFSPAKSQDLVVPVIFSFPQGNAQGDAGFAIVTDDPPAEIKAAGHDRCPIIIQPEAIDAWLDVGVKTSQDFNEILTQHRQLHFVHQLPTAA